MSTIVATTIQGTNLSDGTSTIGMDQAVGTSPAVAWAVDDTSAAYDYNFNLASVTDNSTGNNNFNLTNALTGTNNPVGGTQGAAASYGYFCRQGTTTQVYGIVENVSLTRVDARMFGVCVGVLA